MNADGHIKEFMSNEEAEKAGFDVPVDVNEMTANQASRFKHDVQPVVLPHDRKSKLARRKMKAFKNSKRGSNLQPGKKKEKEEIIYMGMNWFRLVIGNIHGMPRMIVGLVKHRLIT